MPILEDKLNLSDKIVCVVVDPEFLKHIAKLRFQDPNRVKNLICFPSIFHWTKHVIENLFNDRVHKMLFVHNFYHTFYMLQQDKNQEAFKSNLNHITTRLLDEEVRLRTEISALTKSLQSGSKIRAKTREEKTLQLKECEEKLRRLTNRMKVLSIFEDKLNSSRCKDVYAIKGEVRGLLEEIVMKFDDDFDEEDLLEHLGYFDDDENEEEDDEATSNEEDTRSSKAARRQRTTLRNLVGKEFLHLYEEDGTIEEFEEFDIPDHPLNDCNEDQTELKKLWDQQSLFQDKKEMSKLLFLLETYCEAGLSELDLQHKDLMSHRLNYARQKHMGTCLDLAYLQVKDVIEAIMTHAANSPNVSPTAMWAAKSIVSFLKTTSEVVEAYRSIVLEGKSEPFLQRMPEDLSILAFYGRDNVVQAYSLIVEQIHEWCVTGNDKLLSLCMENCCSWNDLKTELWNANLKNNLPTNKTLTHQDVVRAGELLMAKHHFLKENVVATGNKLSSSHDYDKKKKPPSNQESSNSVYRGISIPPRGNQIV
jgi:hypothetical protein